MQKSTVFQLIEPIGANLQVEAMRVLGIETSCDETGVAVYDSERGLMAHALHSQAALHQVYGGVVPELASRDHVRKLLPLIRAVLGQACIDSESLDGIAYTAGPGLIGALLVGASVAQSIAWTLGVPAIGLHHMEGHLLAAMLDEDPPALPCMSLLVSGGHTQLVEVKSLGHYCVLGQSLDDAVGEAFDKTAKLLGLGYPGGPALAALALKGEPNRYTFPRPMTDRPGLDFSFSGLKTHALVTLRESDGSLQAKADIARAFEDAAVETLVTKSRRAMAQTGLRRLVVAGGVGANARLRDRLAVDLAKHQVRVFYPRLEFCTDNGAMIAYAGWLRLRGGERSGSIISARARWPMEELSPIS